MDQRQKNEVLYFQTGPWKKQALDLDRVRGVSLRTYIQTLPDHHIERELLKVRSEIRKLIENIENKIDRLGEDRPTLSHMRMFLSKICLNEFMSDFKATNCWYRM